MRSNPLASEAPSSANVAIATQLPHVTGSMGSSCPRRLRALAAWIGRHHAAGRSSLLVRMRGKGEKAPPEGKALNVARRTAARDGTLVGDTIDAQRAYEVGYANKIVPIDQLMPTAMDYARRIAETAPMPSRMPVHHSCG